MVKYTTLSYQVKYNKGLELCKKLYLDNYPVMRGLKISENKMIFERIKFYLKGSKYYDEFMESVKDD